MRLAMSCHPSHGGSGVAATELAMALAERGHEVHLVACARPFRLPEETDVIFDEVNVTDYPLFRYPPHDLSLANRLAGITKEHGIEVIHAHYAIPHAVAALLAQSVVGAKRVGIVTTLHGTDITLVGSHRDFYDLTRHAMVNSDAVTTVSAWLRDETVKRFCLEKAPEVIPNFVDPRKLNPEGRVPYPDDGEPFHLSHASNMRPVKRVADIIRVFDLVQKEIPARLTMLGDGPEKGCAMELVGELDLCDRVSFCGVTENLSKLLRKSHMYMLLSDHESFGLSALEAMACGTPAAATSCGGMPEVVTDGVTGLLCRVGDIEGTARRIVAALKDRKAWEKMSHTASAEARERFGAETVVPLYEKLYERVKR